MQPLTMRLTAPGPAGESQAFHLLEQAFLEEMLKYAGPKPMEGGFSGGTAEGQFSHFLIREYAEILSNSLNLGLQSGQQEGRHD